MEKFNKLVNEMTEQQMIMAWNEAKKSDWRTAAIIRGAISDRLEREYPEKFDQWLDNDSSNKIDFFFA